MFRLKPIAREPTIITKTPVEVPVDKKEIHSKVNARTETQETQWITIEEALGILQIEESLLLEWMQKGKIVYSMDSEGKELLDLQNIYQLRNQAMESGTVSIPKGKTRSMNTMKRGRK